VGLNFGVGKRSPPNDGAMDSTIPRAATALIAFSTLFVGAAGPVVAAPDDEPIVPADWIGIEPVDKRGRRPFRPDQVFRRYLYDAAAPAPKTGETLKGETGEERKWERLPWKDGRVDLEKRRTYAYCQVESAEDRVVLADLRGGVTLWVNGQAFTGDIYNMGYGGVPVRLRKGANHVFAVGLRGRFSLTLTPVSGTVALGIKDATLPNLLRGADLSGAGAVPVLNLTDQPLTGVVLEAGDGERFEIGQGRADHAIPPLSLAKLPFPIRTRPGATAGDVESVPFPLTVTPGNGAGSQYELELQVKAPGDPHLRTFRSWIDGSVQRYGVLPPSAPTGPETALILTLHGASVKALGQVRSYSQKTDLWVVAPTNRRPFGFDWQDWGRLDAYEVLEHALAAGGIAPERVYLTGHSMGGHGAWHLAANDPDRFVAVAPSAGWVDFDAYGGRPTGPLTELWHRADASSHTLELLPNLVQLPVFVLHGEKDDNVPTEHGRRMVKALRDAGGRVESHFQEDAGHWWNGDAAKGTDCVDWPGIMDLFRSSRPRVAPSEVHLLTVDPVIDSTHRWVAVHQPLRYGEAVRVDGKWDVVSGTISVKTANARAIQVGAPRGAQPRRFVIDGQDFAAAAWPQWFVRDGDEWAAAAAAPSSDEKGPDRSGPFKRAFDREFVLVLPTAGTREENAQAVARARYDAQVWWYRGNGLARIVTDEEFVGAAGVTFSGRNAILYGNADTNAAWAVVFDESNPIDVRRGSLRVGERTWEGDDLGAVFVRPRADDAQALAAAFADTGVRGARLGYGLLTFVSGVGYPDYAAFSGQVLESGDGGVLAAGWFDHAWRLDGNGHTQQ